MSEIKTPETHPDHETVGRTFTAWNGERYWCDSYDSRIGFWMTNIDNEGDRRNVSERAIGRTFHLDYDASYDIHGKPRPRPTSTDIKP